MSGSFIIVKNLHEDLIRINVDAILSYYGLGDYTQIQLTENQIVMTQTTVEDLDKAITELYYMVKMV